MRELPCLYGMTLKKTKMVSVEDSLPGRQHPGSTRSEAAHGFGYGSACRTRRGSGDHLSSLWLLLGSRKARRGSWALIQPPWATLGGFTPNPTYEEVCTGLTGHAETVRVLYTPAKLPTEKLLQAFFESHDPTSLNKQGGDIGTQYRSAIFTTTQERRGHGPPDDPRLSGQAHPGRPRPDRHRSNLGTQIRPVASLAEDEHRVSPEEPGWLPVPCTHWYRLPAPFLRPAR